MTPVVPAVASRIAALQGMPGIDPDWSRLVDVADRDHEVRTWHVLDNGAEARLGTMLCVHGNPTWSYLWRRFLAAAPEGWRVVAVDQLGMGYSERTDAPRDLDLRIDDLGRVTAALGITGPTVVVAHDWGGLVSVGWALEHRDQLAGLVLTNTGLAQPSTIPAPRLIQLARSRPLRQAVCVRTPAFIRATTALSRPSLPPSVRAAYAAPYATADRRRAIADFVADIPFESDHPSRSRMDAIGDRLPELADVPTLLLWGPRDPVFSEGFLDDVRSRLPHADVHRYAGSSHLVTEDAPQTAEDTWRWVGDLGHRSVPTDEPADDGDLGRRMRDRADSDEVAIIELRGGLRRTTWRTLNRRVEEIAGGLHALGVRSGDRVAVLVPPGVELTAVVYACWRLGAVIVVADAGLGARALGGALKSAAPDYVVGIRIALAAIAALGVPGQRILAGTLPTPARRLLQVVASLDDFTDARPAPWSAPATGEAAVLFTSGATGPPKGVVYHHPQLRAQVELVRSVMGIGPDDRLVAAFAPFALYGPAMGIGVAVPDMDVTRPATLTAAALAHAVSAVDATVVFASPAALRTVSYTVDEMPAFLHEALRGVKRVLSAGAPVPVGMLRRLRARVLPEAELHTPYGMTEVLPVTDIELAEIEAVGHGNGVCVGRPMPGVVIKVSPLDPDGSANGPLVDTAELTGEICVAAGHVKQRYDRLWATERESSRDPGYHRTGDVGHLDPEGRLWVEGRLVHVVTTADGPVTPVGIEQRIETLETIRSAAVVGVGPAGTQQVVAVVVAKGKPSGQVLADPVLAAAVRDAAQVPLAAVLLIAAQPVDIRHASKIDRTRLAAWASAVLAGRRAGKP